LIPSRSILLRESWSRRFEKRRGIAVAGEIGKIQIVTIALVALCCFFQGCATQQATPEIKGGLSPDRLAYFNDQFDSFRDDLWDKSGLLFQESQIRNYKSAAMRIENGELVIETQTGSFSKGGVGSKYSLKGDFDIQLDCGFDFQNGLVNFDQIMSFVVLEKGTRVGEPNRSVAIALIKREKIRKSGIFSSYRDRPEISGRILGKSWIPMRDFRGSLRIVRSGGDITTFYKRAEEARWNKRDTFPSTGNDACVGFVVQNFIIQRQGITADKPVVGRFDNFRINAAQGIVEEEI
jgi:hypothetical protein